VTALLFVLIVGSTLAGIAWERRDAAAAHRGAARVIRLIVWVLGPFVVLFVMPHIELRGGLGIGLVFAYLELALVGVLAYLISTRVLRRSRAVTGAVVCTSILGNTGYLGVPLVGALLGREHIADAVAWDATVSAVMLYGPAFAVGAALGSDSGDDRRARVRAFFTRNPVLYALIAGLLIPRSWSPDTVFHVAKWVASVGIVPLGFFVLGVNLIEEGHGRWPPLAPPAALVTALRLLAAPALLGALVLISGASIPKAFFLQAAMPSGINSLIVAHTFGLDLRTTAGAIAWSTVTALLGAAVLAVVL